MSEPAAIKFNSHGETCVIPVGLLEIQRSWDRSDADCKRLQRATDAASLAAYDAAWEQRMAATRAKWRDPWLAPDGVVNHVRDLALRKAAAA